MVRNKPYLSSIRDKHPTISEDSIAYASGAQKSFDSKYNTYIESIETIDLAIRTIANIISLADMKLYKEDSKGKLKPAKVKNVDLTFPNETDSSVDFLRKLAVSIFSQGAGLIVTEEAKRGKLPGKMINFYTLDVAKITAESDGKKLISNFVYKAENGSDISYPADSCIYINDSIDPSNLLYSLTRLKALNDVILMQAGIVRSTKDLLSGGAKDSSIISSETPIGERNMKRIKKEFDAFMAKASSSSLFLNAPLTVTKVGNSMTGTEMLSLLTKINSMMIEAFAIPPYLLGRYDSGANRNTEITYSLRIFFSMQIKPVLKNIELHFTRYLKYSLGLKNIVMRFDYKDLDILKLSDEEQSKKVLEQLKGGLISLDEARELTEYDPIGSDASSNVFMPAYLLGNYPVSYNNFAEDLANANGVAPNAALPSGNAGGSDNTSVVTNSRGGPSEAN